MSLSDQSLECPDLDEVVGASSWQPFRPIQYLGSKLRALPEILSASSSLIKPGSAVADLFTGTTVVAQAFARSGYRVSTADTQQYPIFFARALLGIERQPGESCDFEKLSSAGVSASDRALFGHWSNFSDQEDNAVASNNSEALEQLNGQLPLIWRLPTHRARQYIESDCVHSAHGDSPLLTEIYAGYYFGVRQALTLDSLRQSAERALTAGRISHWQYAATLTAIMSAASKAAHTAGKHFAQPLNAGTLQNVTFLRSRLLQDRRIDVEEEFKASCNAINDTAPTADSEHAAWQGPAERFDFNSAKIDLYYLDPPYTAQQYSRFYHVLETVCSYQYPKLYTDGQLTTGLYPEVRYKSAFSSKKRAPEAFQAILRGARTNGASVILSYSQSTAASVGNARMISLDQLLTLCRQEYGHGAVEWQRLEHRYRQFNSVSNSNSRRDDPEILITCRPR